MKLGIRGKIGALLATAVLTAVVTATPVLATSSSVDSGYLPGGDYLQTNVWLGNMPWNTFNAQSSTWVIGNNPYYPYITDDDLTVNVNGWDISVSWPPSGHVVSQQSATFYCEEIYTGYCGNVVYNITFDGGIWWNNTATDWSRTVLYQNTQSYYNHASTTNWCC